MRLRLILSAFLEIANTSKSNDVDSNCSDYDQCLLNCVIGDDSCKASCVTNLKKEHKDCPRQNKKAILTLNSFYSDNSPILIQPDGGLTENFKFKINDDTELFHSCSAVLNGELFVFGGGYNGEKNYAKQISKVSGCELKRIGDLNYDFEFGTCSTFHFPEERILMCFGNSFNDGCESFDGAVFNKHQNSRTNHYITTLANFDDSPLAVGDWTGSGHSKAEVFNIAANIWTEVAKYPYHPDISNYATVTTSKGALIIGGLCQSCGSKQVATVASYNEDGWNQLDDLQSIRAGHRAIVNDDKVFIVGGDGTKYTEIWTYKNGKRHVELAVPQLYDFADYPELSLVDINFCVRP